MRHFLRESDQLNGSSTPNTAQHRLPVTEIENKFNQVWEQMLWTYTNHLLNGCTLVSWSVSVSGVCRCPAGILISVRVYWSLSLIQGFPRCVIRKRSMCPTRMVPLWRRPLYLFIPKPLRVLRKTNFLPELGIKLGTPDPMTPDPMTPDPMTPDPMPHELFTRPSFHPSIGEERITHTILWWRRCGRGVAPCLSYIAAPV